MGDVENNGSDVIANPDNLPLSLQQRYLMARANNLFDKNYTIHNFRDATTGMDLARELNENFKVLATPHAISKWRPVLQSDILPRNVQEVGSFPYYLASEVYGLTSKERNAPVHLSKKFHGKSPWENLLKELRPTSKTVNAVVQTDPPIVSSTANQVQVPDIKDGDDSDDNDEETDNNNSGSTPMITESVINDDEKSETYDSSNYELAKKEGTVLFLNGVDYEIVAHFLRVLSEANDKSINSFAKFLTESAGQWYLTSNYIQIEIQPVFGRIHFANRETEQNLLEFLSTAVLDTEKKLLHNPLIFNESYIDFTAFAKGYELFDNDYDMNYQPLVRYLVAVFNNWAYDAGASSQLIQLRHSVIKSQHTFLQKLYEKDFLNYLLYIVKLFDKLTENTPFVLRPDAVENSGIKEIFNGLFLLLPQFQQARQQCVQIVNLITPSHVRKTDFYKNNVDALLPEAKVRFPNFVEDTETFLELLQYCFCSYYTFPNGERQPVEHLFRKLDNKFFEEFIAIGLDLELNSTIIGRAITQCFTTLYYMYFTIVMTYQNDTADVPYQNAINEFRELLNPKLLSAPNVSLRLEQFFSLVNNFNAVVEVLSNQGQGTYIDDELGENFAENISLPSIPLVNDDIEITHVEPGNRSFITPALSLMSIDNSHNTSDDFDPFISDLEMDNVSLDGYDGTVLRSIGNRDADLLYNALSTEAPNVENFDDGYDGHVITNFNDDYSDIEIDSGDDMHIDNFNDRDLLFSALNADEPSTVGFDDGYNGHLLRNVILEAPMYDLSYAQSMSLPDGDNVDDLLDDGYDNTVLNALDSYNKDLLEAAYAAETPNPEYDDGYDGNLIQQLGRQQWDENDNANIDIYNEVNAPISEGENFDDGYDGTVLPLFNSDTVRNDDFDDGYDGTVLPLINGYNDGNEEFDDGYDGTVLPILHSIAQDTPNEIPTREDIDDYWSQRMAPEHRFDIIQEYQDALRYSNTEAHPTNSNRVNNILNTLATANVITEEEQARLQRRRQQSQNRQR